MKKGMLCFVLLGFVDYGAVALEDVFFGGTEEEEPFLQYL
jgi:hypothetical protein